MWVRGLKPKKPFEHHGRQQSHPMWVRGLKQSTDLVQDVHKYVAPYVGAWIETLSSKQSGGIFDVAPYVGAWIETDTSCRSCRKV